MYTLTDLYVINKEAAKATTTPDRMERDRNEVISRLRALLNASEGGNFEIDETAYEIARRKDQTGYNDPDSIRK